MKEVMGVIVYNIDIYKKSVSMVFCIEIVFKLYLSGYEGFDEGLVKWKFELLEIMKMKLMREEMGGNMVFGY